MKGILLLVNLYVMYKKGSTDQSVRQLASITGIGKSEVRFTEDVDLITSLVGLTSWHSFQSNLLKRGV
jgi:hypothetical protein